VSIFEQLNDAGDSDRRRELAREVANLFFVAEERGFERTQVDDFGHIMCKLLDNMQVDERVALSTRMSATENAPHSLAVSLARDDIKVASPMLENSAVLTEEDLVNIADETDTDHRLALSRRENLTSRVTDTLISHEESEVMRSVAENKTAEISETGYSTLVRHSTDDTTLLTVLVRRADLPEEHTKQLLPLLDEEQRKKVVAMMSQNGGAALKEMIVEAKSQSSTRKIDQSSQRIEGKALAKEVESGKASLTEASLRLAQERKPRALAIVFSEVSLLPETKTFGAIVNADSELLMLLCRALELPYGVFAEIDKLRCETVKIERTATADTQQGKYEAVTVENARKTLRFVNLMVKAS